MELFTATMALVISPCLAIVPLVASLARALADAFPYVERRYELLTEDAVAIANDDGRLREALRDQVSLGAAYEYAVYSECNAVYVLRGDIQSFYDFYFGLREGDPDTE